MSNSSVSGPNWVLLLVAALASGMLVEPVRADDCATLSHPVYIAGSSAANAFLPKIAAELKKLTPSITVVAESKASGSCTGVGFFAGAQSTALSGVGKIYDDQGKEIAGGCALNNNTVDIGISDVWASSCGMTLPASVRDTFGPVQTMTFVVPVSSTQSIISAEAAYLVFGFGNDSEVSPWNDASMMQVRSATSGTQQMIGANIKVPAAKFKGMSNSGGGDVLNMLTAAATAGNAEKAIGILATDVSDVHTKELKVLGYQHYGQSCAYWPNSTATNFDKANIRDGHYPIWGPMHLLAKLEGGAIASEDVKKVVDYLSGAVEPTSFDLINLEAKGGLVPICAMQVTRSEDAGAMASFQPEKGCTCKFLNEVNGTAPAECKSCAMDSDCPSSAPHCNYKFCEVK
jgi:ABC-type phosphate transport system substrate-binding protein